MKIRLALFLLFYALILEGQEPFLQQTGDYITIGIGLPINTVRDKAHSPLAYRGMGLRFFASYEEIRSKRISKVTLSLDNIGLKAYVKPRQDVRRKTSLTDIQLSVGYYRRLGDEDVTAAQHQYLGASYEFQLNAREYPLPANNINGFLLQTSLGIGFLDRRSPDGNDDWTITSSARLPLISAIYRPTFIGLPDVLHKAKPGTKEIIKGFKVVTVDKFFKLSANLDLDRFRQPWRSNRYTYNWRIFTTPLPETKSLISTTGALQVGYRSKL